MVTAAKCDLGLVPIEQGSEAPSAVVNDSLIVWVAWKSQVFSLRAKKTSLLSFLNFFLFTLQTPMTAVLIPGKHGDLLGRHLLAVTGVGLSWASCVKSSF